MTKTTKPTASAAPSAAEIAGELEFIANHYTEHAGWMNALFGAIHHVTFMNLDNANEFHDLDVSSRLLVSRLAGIGKYLTESAGAYAERIATETKETFGELEAAERSAA